MNISRENRIRPDCSYVNKCKDDSCQVLYACLAVWRNIRWLKRMRINRVEVLEFEVNKKNQENE